MRMRSTVSLWRVLWAFRSFAMSEGAAKIQDKRSSKLTTKVASEFTDEGSREERAFAKGQQKPTAKKGTSNDALSSSSKDNLLSQPKKPKRYVFILITCKTKRYKASTAWGTRT